VPENRGKIADISKAKARAPDRARNNATYSKDRSTRFRGMRAARNLVYRPRKSANIHSPNVGSCSRFNLFSFYEARFTSESSYRGTCGLPRPDGHCTSGPRGVAGRVGGPFRKNRLSEREEALAKFLGVRETPNPG
jgi:hypothetical protein